MKKQISYKIVSLVFAVLVVCFVIGFYVLAVWTEPQLPPPQGNVPVPLNVSINAQSKQGALVIGTNGAVTTGLIVQNGNVGIGTTTPGAKLEVAGQVKITGGSPAAGKVLTSDASGLSSWQTPAMGGGITQLNQGTGITLSPNPITNIGTISANITYLQRRVTGTCAINQAIRVINADGTVTCVNLPSSAICTWSGRQYSTGARCCAGGQWICTAAGTWSFERLLCTWNPNPC